ncbi:MAG: hypothetical protein AB7P40_08340 [Chloroflexota bacterium]
MTAPQQRHGAEDESSLRPYLAILAVAVVTGLGLLLFLAGHRQEIMAMLTQLPT